jgi:hypothetical protein
MAELLFVYLVEDPAPGLSHIAMGGAMISMCDRRIDGSGWQRRQPPFVLTRTLFWKLEADPDHFCHRCVRQAGHLVDLP